MTTGGPIPDRQGASGGSAEGSLPIEHPDVGLLGIRQAAADLWDLAETCELPEGDEGNRILDQYCSEASRLDALFVKTPARTLGALRLKARFLSEELAHGTCRPYSKMRGVLQNLLRLSVDAEAMRTAIADLISAEPSCYGEKEDEDQ